MVELINELVASTVKIVFALFLMGSLLCGLFLLDNANLGLAQNVIQSPTFTISIAASINNYSSTSVFGVNPNSTVAYSSEYDSIASYPIGGGVYCYFNYLNSSMFKPLKLSKYIVPYNDSITWHLEVESIDQEGILTINWSSGTNFGSLILEDGIINSIIYADMNAVDNFSYRATGGGVCDFDIVFQSATVSTPTPTSSPTPTPSPTPTLTPTSTITSSPSPTPSPSPTVSPIITPSESPTQRPTLEPSPTPNNAQENLTPILIIIGLVVAVFVVGLLVYSRKRRRIKHE